MHNIHINLYLHQVGPYITVHPMINTFSTGIRIRRISAKCYRAELLVSSLPGTVWSCSFEAGLSLLPRRDANLREGRREIGIVLVSHCPIIGGLR